LGAQVFYPSNEEGGGVSDILDGIAQLRLIFMREQLEPPTVILLKSNEEGHRFLSIMRQSYRWSAIVGSSDLGNVVEMADGSAWMEIKVMDIAVRWPANRIATPDGSWAFA
jgi:hypothetical protein